MNERAYEDYTVGERIVSRGHTLTEAAIIDFAFRYDPQPFHIDVEAARQGPFGGVIASGFQTLAVAFRILWDTGAIAGGLGSPGFDELRWLKPVRPGDTIRTRIEILEKRVSSSKPDRGILRVRHDVVNQRDEPAMTFTSTVFVPRRDQGAPS
ncbi:MAG: MaoC family dehydratase [Alphaproteobacteria bacterium]|nr:MaoC family dehydratase [Alphaproteobacteria bacterium]